MQERINLRRMREGGHGFAWFEAGMSIEKGFVEGLNLGRTFNHSLAWEKVDIF